MAVKWYGKELRSHCHASMDKRIAGACIFLAGKAKEELSRSQPTSGTGALKRGLDPSKEGEFPKVVTGSFRRTVTYEMDYSAHAGRVGTNDPRGKWFELGTMKMARRPWLSLLMSRHGDAAQRIIERGSSV